MRIRSAPSVCRGGFQLKQLELVAGLAEMAGMLVPLGSQDASIYQDESQLLEMQQQVYLAWIQQHLRPDQTGLKQCDLGDELMRDQ